MELIANRIKNVFRGCNNYFLRYHLDLSNDWNTFVRREIVWIMVERPKDVCSNFMYVVIAFKTW